MTFLDIYNVLNVISPVILVIGISIGIYYYKILDKIHKCIFVYLFMMLSVDMIGRAFEYFSGNNLIVLLVYSLIELILFVVFYYKYLFKAKHRLILGLSIATVFYILWEILILMKIEAKEFQSYAKVADDFVIITLALGFFHEKINIYKESKWDNFQLNAAILIFFSINLIFFLPINFILNETTGVWFWLGILIITVLFYLYLTHSVWKNGRTQKLLPSGSR